MHTHSARLMNREMNSPFEQILFPLVIAVVVTLLIRTTIWIRSARRTEVDFETNFEFLSGKFRLFSRLEVVFSKRKGKIFEEEAKEF